MIMREQGKVAQLCYPTDGQLIWDNLFFASPLIWSASAFNELRGQHITKQ